MEDLVDEETIPSGVDSNWYLFPLDTNRLCYCARPAVNWVLPPIVLDAGDGSLLAQIQTGEMSTSFNVSSDGNRLLSHNIDDRTQVWVRRRPESRYGFMALPEFWLTTVLTPALLWAIYRDARDFKWFPARTARKKVTPRIPAWKRHLLASRAAKRATAARAHKSIVDARIRSRNMARTPRRA